ncbi:MAG: hypothetical protein OXJ52_06545 [Oligoflexia bacterium]|nr:hypothetical protein [Oligoflexia bacterium]
MSVKGKPIRVIKESPTGRNLRFENRRTGQEMSRSEFVKAIKGGQYQDYHTRNINGIETPVSNPDGKEGNNLD